MTIRPFSSVWQDVEIVVGGGEIVRTKAHVPIPRFRALCARQFTDGEEYALGPVDGVPSKSRAAFFAEVGETWKNLPDDDERFPAKEYLRKWVLVAVGHCTEATYDLETEKDARTMALAARKLDQYAVIVRRGQFLRIATAKSIATGAVTADEFRIIHRKASDVLAELIGTTRAELVRHSKNGEAA